MSFLSRESSIFAGEPVELYQFVNLTQTWLYTSGAADLTYLNQLYTAIPMERGQIDLTRDIGKAQLQIQVPRNIALVNQYLNAPPDGQTLLTIFRNHIGDGEYAAYWKGRITSVEATGSNGTVVCDSDYTSLVGRGARATFAIPCRYSLYGPGCNVNDQAFKVQGNLASVSGAAVSSAAFGTVPDGWLAGGKIEITVGGIIYRRMILTHVGANVTLMYPIPGLLGSEPCAAYAGCDHSLNGANGCQKFQNTPNYGGWPWKPIQNPFDGVAL